MSLKNIHLNNINVHMIDSRIFGRNIIFVKALSENKKTYKNIVSLGGGTATDIAKYISKKTGSKFICIPSMLSTNAYSTDKVALVVGNNKITLDAKLADHIILDTNLIRKAEKQNLYGLADIFSIYIALADWELANNDINEMINDEIFLRSKKLLDDTVAFVVSTDRKVISNDIMKLFKNIGEAGYITNIYGTGRPESGSEHIFAKDLENRIEVPHGVSVSIGIILMSIAQNRYSEDIFKCLDKIGTLKMIDELKISRKLLTDTLVNLIPRCDRYSIINRLNMDDAYVDNLLNQFSIKTGIELK
ncbi:MAG: iron-containing alcohol dehydrogenase [Candidatus Saccharibacteria bacterium]